MSSIFGPGTTLALLEKFRQAVSDLTMRADKLNDEFRSRIARERLRHQATLQEQEKQSAAALNELEAAFGQSKTKAEQRYRDRKARIGKAFQAAKEQRLQQIDNELGNRRYEMQKRMLQAERDRESGLTAAATARKEFQARLEEQQREIAGLEKKAQTAFSGYGSLRRGFFAAYQQAKPEATGDEQEIFDQAAAKMAAAGEELQRFRGLLLTTLFRHLPLWITLGILLGLVPLLNRFGIKTWSYETAAIAGGICIVLSILLHLLAMQQGRGTARRLSDALAAARTSHDLAGQKSERHYQDETQRLQREYVRIQEESDQQFKRAQSLAGEQRVACRMKSDQKAVRAEGRNEGLYRAVLARADREHAEAQARTRAASQEEAAGLRHQGEAKLRQLELEHDQARAAIEREWHDTLEPIYASLLKHNEASAKLFPPWTEVPIRDWAPPKAFSSAAKFGELTVDLAKLAGTLPKEKRLVLPGTGTDTTPPPLAVDLALSLPNEGSILLETGETGREEAISTLNDAMFRLLATAPPGRLAFTILDPVGLGQNFAGIMHMADYEEQIITNRIWTQSTQIEQRLADLNEHMEKVIQMYLRNEYATIAEYNEQAGVIAEKYHFLVIADFPANFTDVAIRRLLSIASSGARCGVYLLMHWDRRTPSPQDFVPDELRKNSFGLTARGRDFLVGGRAIPGVTLALEPPPSPEIAIEFVNRIGQQSRDSSRVEVPFEHVVPSEAEEWSEDTTTELRVPIGRTGATKLQYLAMGKGTCQHGLVAGKTGSGKSTLFHVIITNLSLWCSPEQVEFYLVDFKKGVEFKCYATHKLPHAKVVAIESDREFGLSVLQRVDDELRRRGDMFRKLGVQDIAGYKRAGGKESIPRCLLVIDEFQEFFVEDDKVAQTASLLLDRIVRQGRAFGIHVLLGSQTLGGAYTVARTTLGQMVIRIALQCNEADSYLIMDDSNPAPRLLSRPGEGIYNDSAGMLEGNSPFQVVWLPDTVRDRYLAKVSARAGHDEKHYSTPIVFEGNAPADVRENQLLAELLASAGRGAALNRDPGNPPPAPRIWLGAPNSIKGPTEVVFHRQGGNNLLLVGQREDAVLAILGIGLVTLAAQYPLGSVKFIVLDGTAPGSSQRGYMESVLGLIPHEVVTLKTADLGQITTELAEELKRRSEASNPEAAPAAFLIINGLQKYNRLRYEEDFSFSTGETGGPPNPANVLNSLVSEGTRLGLHVIAACDTYNNVVRYLSRKALSEFELRVLFQMSANDSANLIDNPKASMLGLHRAVLQNAQEGYLETFRPYALPEERWLEEAGKNLDRLRGRPDLAQK